MRAKAGHNTARADNNGSTATAQLQLVKPRSYLLDRPRRQLEDTD